MNILLFLIVGGGYSIAISAAAVKGASYHYADELAQPERRIYDDHAFDVHELMYEAELVCDD